MNEAHVHERCAMNIEGLIARVRNPQCILASELVITVHINGRWLALPAVTCQGCRTGVDCIKLLAA